MAVPLALRPAHGAGVVAAPAEAALFDDDDESIMTKVNCSRVRSLEPRQTSSQRVSDRSVHEFR